MASAKWSSPTVCWAPTNSQRGFAGSSAVRITSTYPFPGRSPDRALGRKRLALTSAERGYIDLDVRRLVQERASVKLKPIENQVVVVMGASSGIGRETALHFAKRGGQGGDRSQERGGTTLPAERDKEARRRGEGRGRRRLRIRPGGG